MDSSKKVADGDVIEPTGLGKESRECELVLLAEEVRTNSNRVRAHRAHRNSIT